VIPVSFCVFLGVSACNTTESTLCRLGVFCEFVLTITITDFKRLIFRTTNYMWTMKIKRNTGNVLNLIHVILCRYCSLGSCCKVKYSCMCTGREVWGGSVTISSSIPSSPLTRTIIESMLKLRWMTVASVDNCSAAHHFRCDLQYSIFCKHIGSSVSPMS